MISVRLTNDEVRAAERNAARRNAYHEARGTPDAHGLRATSEYGRELCRRGCLAEAAVSKHLGVPTVGFAENYKAIPADVGANVQVRSSPRPNGDLLIHPSDPDDAPFVLVRTHRAPWFEVVGWMYGRDAKTPEFWRLGVLHLPRPAFLVPAERLRPMASLPRTEVCGACEPCPCGCGGVGYTVGPDGVGFTKCDRRTRDGDGGSGQVSQL